MALYIRIAAIVSAVEGLRTRDQFLGSLQSGEGGTVDVPYTFEEFVQEFGRSYDEGSEEYTRRAAIFRDSLSQIHAKNSRANRSWTAGVYPFMDWTGAERSERLHGYKPSSFRRVAGEAPPVALQTGARKAAYEKLYGGNGDNFEAPAPPVRNQGACGSCWAIAAVEAVEAQLMKAGSSWPQQEGAPQLSPQALLDCVRNPKHCGGDGGCEGATPQLAFDYMQSNGLPLETDIPYSPPDVTKGTCPIEPYPEGKMRVSLAGWRDLPANQAQPLMQALVEEGPVVVAVHAHHWDLYKSGVFDDCVKDAIPAHSVLLKGYGVADLSSGRDTSLRKYWLIQNSWGAQWGEEGSIRLLRRDDDDHWCGTDNQPQKGAACDDDPQTEITVCGSCGILYDATIPQVGRTGVVKAVDAADAKEAKAHLSQLNAMTAHFRAQSQVDEGTAPSADVSVSDVALSSPGWHSQVEAFTVADADVRAADDLETDADSDADGQDKAANGQTPPTEKARWLPQSNAGSPVVEAQKVAEEAPPSRAQSSQPSSAHARQAEASDKARIEFSAASSVFTKWKAMERENSLGGYLTS